MIELVCYTEGDEGFAARLTARGADMPTILFRQGWRIFFFANEGHEPIHVHCKKGRAHGKFWIHPDEYNITQAYVRYMTRQQEREVRRIRFDHFDEIVEVWNEFKRTEHE